MNLVRASGLAAAGALLLAGFGEALATAFGQAPPPQKYIPYTMTEERQASLKTWLGNQPFNFASPLISTLDGYEQEAQNDAVKAATPAQHPPEPKSGAEKPK